MNDLENTSISFSVVSENNLISLFTYGDDKFDAKESENINVIDKIYQRIRRGLMSNFGDNLAASKFAVPRSTVLLLLFLLKLFSSNLT